MMKGDKRWCYQCNKYRALSQFKKAHPDFPTRDGYNFACNSCAPGAVYRKERDPEGRVKLILISAGKGRKKARV